MTTKERYEDFKERCISRKANKTLLESEKATLQKELDEIDIEVLEKSSIVLNKLSEKQRTAAKHKLEELCTLALQYSVSPHKRTEIELGRRANKPIADVKIVNDKNGVKADPIEGDGGGLVDIVSTTLQYICAEVWADPVIDGPMLLDEAFKHLSKEYVPMIAEFLKQISTDFERQTIMCTHNDFIKQGADRIIEVSLDANDRSKIKITDPREAINIL